MYTAFGHTVEPPAVLPPPFIEKSLAGVTYKVASDKERSLFKGNLINWKIRSRRAEGTVEVVEMTPYNESTGPRDPGDGFRWADTNATGGKGVIIVPPVGYEPGSDNVMRMTDGYLRGVAGDDFSYVRDLAGGDLPGFVLYEPAEGWQNVGDEPVEVADEVPVAMLVGGALAGFALVWYFWIR